MHSIGLTLAATLSNAFSSMSGDHPISPTNRVIPCQIHITQLEFAHTGLSAQESKEFKPINVNTSQNQTSQRSPAIWTRAKECRREQRSARMLEWQRHALKNHLQFVKHGAATGINAVRFSMKRLATSSSPSRSGPRVETLSCRMLLKTILAFSRHLSKSVNKGPCWGLLR